MIYLITKVKSCWAGLTSWWAIILVSLCCMPGEVRLASLCSSLAPPTSAIVRGLTFSRSQPDLRAFLRVLRFSSLSKVNSQSKKSSSDAVPRDHHTRPSGGSHRGAFHMHSADPVELRPSQFSPRAASMGD